MAVDPPVDGVTMHQLLAPVDAFSIDGEPARSRGLHVALHEVGHFLLHAGRVNTLSGHRLVADLEGTSIHELFGRHERLDLIRELLDLSVQFVSHLAEFLEFVYLCSDVVGCDDHSYLFLPHCAVGACNCVIGALLHRCRLYLLSFLQRKAPKADPISQPRGPGTLRSKTFRTHENPWYSSIPSHGGNEKGAQYSPSSGLLHLQQVHDNFFYFRILNVLRTGE